MKLRGPIYFSVLILVFLIGANWPTQENDTLPLPEKGLGKESVLVQTILNGLDRYHFKPQNVNDDFSKKVFETYIDRLDGGRRFFTQKDIEELTPYQTSIDDEALSGDYTFFDKSIEFLNASIEKTRGYYKKILEKPFDFTKDEVFHIDSETKPFAKDNDELKEYWRQYLKYETMKRLLDKLEEQEKEDEEIEPKSTKELEEEARKAVLKVLDDWYDRMAKLRRVDRLSTYLNAITNVFDPHTGYYKPKDKEDFDIQISGTLEGIGARLSPEGEFTKVVSIIPGGPAWKQKELEANDLIVKVTQKGEEPVDVTDMHIDDVVGMIRGKKGTEVLLTVKKVDGTYKDIPIIRDVVIIDESYAKSAILSYKDEIDKIGYIKLPQFYADFNRRGGKSSARDVATEVEKLKEEGVNGIVIDLRDNTGGSLRDVVRMTGLFIEEGPIVQVKSRRLEPEILADSDSRVQYDGPLVIMVNSLSASASEIMAAALQDYDRAIIVGSNATFGKGTVQRFVDLDRVLPGFNDVKPLGQIKLTIQKFYRINGGSTQLRGVTPDIILPDDYSFLTIGEQEHEFPMAWSEIEKVPYTQNVYSLDFKEEVKTRSQARVENSAFFQQTVENAKRLKRQSDQNDYSLNMEAFKAMQEERREKAKMFKERWQPIEALEIANPEADIASIEADESKMARNEEWFKNLKKDAYVEEVLFIMKDMIELN